MLPWPYNPPVSHPFTIVQLVLFLGVPIKALILKPSHLNGSGPNVMTVALKYSHNPLVHRHTFPASCPPNVPPINVLLLSPSSFFSTNLFSLPIPSVLHFSMLPSDNMCFRQKYLMTTHTCWAILSVPSLRRCILHRGQGCTIVRGIPGVQLFFYSSSSQ